MIIDKPGRYVLTEPLTTRNSISVATMRAGDEIAVTQVDVGAHKVIGPSLLDWTHWDLPAIPAAPTMEEALRIWVSQCRTESGVGTVEGVTLTEHDECCLRCRPARAALSLASSPAAAPERGDWLAPWYEADGSTVMLPAPEVERRRKLAAKVIAQARAFRADFEAHGRDGVALSNIRPLFAALDDLDGPNASGAPERGDGDRVQVAVTRRADDDETISFDAPGFTTVRPCVDCGVLMRGGPTRCLPCAAKLPRPSPRGTGTEGGK